ncbi:MAG: ParB N-terminal domain-containing protein [Firmicutes bacterium]|nr:ParB N-terminal domain-containing protein [Bacillota bacterium]
MGKPIKVTCKSDTFLPFTQIQDFQGELKTRTQDDVDHLITSIQRHGFAFPFFVWRQPNGVCSCLDGHGRIMALTQLEREGYDIPELPVVYIDAENESEARTKLIQINVVSGRYTDTGFRDLVKDIPDVDLADYNYPDLDLERLDAEMKVLQQAQMNIQPEIDAAWGGDFSDVTFGGDFSSVSGIASTDSGIVSADSEAVDIGGSSDTSAVVGVAATVHGESDDGIREMVVYCPECGEAFIFTYNENVDENVEESKDGE